MKITKTLFVFVFLSVFSRTTGNDFDAFCELVSLSPNSQSWCSNCSDPCNNKCEVECDNGKIISFNASNKGLTTLPDSIGGFTALTSLYF